MKHSTGGMRTLRDLIDEGREHVRVSCEKCNRTETHPLAALLVRHGMSKRLEDLVVQLRADCPKSDELGDDGCGAFLQTDAGKPRSGA